MSTANTEAPAESERRALPPGTRVQEFEILAHIGGGGFGLVYLAQDNALQRKVALKEYMPPLASRNRGSTQVYVTSERDTETFSAGLRSFVNEARLLARFEHAALVKVHRFWEENGTAYMVMPYYDGPTLQRAVEDQRVPTDEASLRRLLNPLLDAVAALHLEQCFHRDISPDNILLTGAGPVLLDFGAARMAIGESSQNFTVILKEGYAPVEQYAREEATAMRQGPWTDIYALAGVIRYVITGRKPPSAVVRMASLRDPMESLAKCAADRYSQPFLRALDTAMEIHVEKRPQTIEAFRALLSSLQSTFENPTLVRPVSGPPSNGVPPRSPPAARPPAVPAPNGPGGSGGPAGPAGPASRPNPARPAKIVQLTDVFPSAGPAFPPGAARPASPGRALENEAGGRRPLLPWAAIALFVPLALAVAGVLYGRFSDGHYFDGRYFAGLHAQTPARADAGEPGTPIMKDTASQQAPDVKSPPEVKPPPAGKSSAVKLPDEGVAPLPVSSKSKPKDKELSPPAASDPVSQPPPARPLPPALTRLLKSAQAGNWQAVETQAAAIIANAPAVPVGDRKASRTANDLGLAALKVHNFRGAASFFESSVHADPSDIEVANNYGYALALAGRKVKAQEVLIGVLMQNPTREVAWTSLVEVRGEDDAQALAALKVALHYAASRQRTLRIFRERALTHPDVHFQNLVKKLLEQSDQVPTVPEGQH